jgi:serine/threonine protein kinase
MSQFNCAAAAVTPLKSLAGPASSPPTFPYTQTPLPFVIFLVKTSATNYQFELLFFGFQCSIRHLVLSRQRSPSVLDRKRCPTFVQYQPLTEVRPKGQPAVMQRTVQFDQESVTSELPKGELDIQEDEALLLPEDDVKRLPFKLGKGLGKGNSAFVQCAEHTKTGIVYAIKTIRLPRRPSQRADTEEHFNSEVSITRRLRGHHHIVRLYATYVTTENVALILQPAAEEGDLERYLSAYERLLEHPEMSVKEIDAMGTIIQRAFGCLASGLKYMHEKQIRHRDIKPGNILIHQGLVVYTDFGAAKDANRPGDSTTEGPANFLTRRWAPPEVLDSRKRNYSADVYSLGCVFVEVFAAISRAVTTDHSGPFSNVMERYHAALRSAAVRAPLDFLPEVIISMTSRDPPERPKASEIFQVIHDRGKFFCSRCQLPKKLYGQWTWHKELCRHYCYLLKDDGSIDEDRVYWDDPATQYKPPPNTICLELDQRCATPFQQLFMSPIVSLTLYSVRDDAVLTTSSQRRQLSAATAVESADTPSEAQNAEDFLSPLDPPAQRISKEKGSASLILCKISYASPRFDVDQAQHIIESSRTLNQISSFWVG